MSKDESPRAVVCCFCGKSWSYNGESPPEELYQQALDHEKQCSQNAYTKEIKKLREENTRLEGQIENIKNILVDPHAVYVNMTRGDISKPSIDQIKTLYPELTTHQKKQNGKRK